ncbi:MAG: nuclear transport factor 2 family protein [Novosphingobium sp.]
MDFDRAKATVDDFNDSINSRDIERLSRLMSDDHIFIDMTDNRVVGKPACMAAWRGFFAAFPDYRNHFEAVTGSAELLVVTGRSTCSDSRLQGPALWTARVRDDVVVEWRVIEDTPSNRARLGVVR